MAKADAVIMVGRLVIAYRQEKVSDETVALYAEKLAAIQPDLLAAAVDRLIETSKFFPAISEIIYAAGLLAGVLLPSAAEVMALVRRADRVRTVFRRDGTPAYTEKEWDWPEDTDPAVIELAKETLAKVGEPSDDEGNPHFGWESGFQKTYEAIAQEVTQKRLADLTSAILPAHERRKIGSGR
jgi:hypothetical protein